MVGRFATRLLGCAAAALVLTGPAVGMAHPLGGLQLPAADQTWNDPEFSSYPPGRGQSSAPPDRVPYVESTPGPPGYVLRDGRKRPFFIAGGAVLAGTYGLLTLAQTAGVTLLVVGAARHDKAWFAPPKDEIGLRLVPAAVGADTGLTLIGRF